MDNPYLFVWGISVQFPIVGFEVIELIELEANVFYWELQKVPESRQVLSCGPWVSIHILHEKDREEKKWKEKKNNKQTKIAY